jgi:hypothetical protein|nr:MAG TPA: hypothetical protein [Caudoviricetes sp.]
MENTTVSGILKFWGYLLIAAGVAADVFLFTRFAPNFAKQEIFILIIVPLTCIIAACGFLALAQTLSLTDKLYKLVLKEIEKNDSTEGKD